MKTRGEQRRQLVKALREQRQRVMRERHRAIRATLVAAREVPDYSQRQLARRMRRAHSFVAKIEAGARHLKVLELYDFAAALGISARDLFARIDDCLSSEVYKPQIDSQAKAESFNLMSDSALIETQVAEVIQRRSNPLSEVKKRLSRW